MLRLSIQHTMRICRESRNCIQVLISVRRRGVPQGLTKSFSDSVGTKRTEADDEGKKRLFVCCDGTWKSASGTITPPTNVARLARSVDRHGWDEDQVVPQIAFYTGGIGTQSVLPVPVDYWYSGATGEGVILSYSRRGVNPRD